MSRPTPDVQILLLGQTSVGKTCTIMRYIENSYCSSFITTIGIDFKDKVLNINGKPIRLRIWDTAGQERFRTITTSYLRGADQLIVFYDTTDASTFKYMEDWIKTIHKHGRTDAKPIIVGTKIDGELPRTVQYEDAMAFCKKHNLHYYEVSGKTGENIEKMYIDAVRISLNLPLETEKTNEKEDNHEKNKNGKKKSCTIS
jgi:small GTP-binding protein